jgi:hypothetical protein
MANKLKIQKTSGGFVHDAFVSPTQIDGAHIGGTGGLVSQTGYQIQPQVYLTGGSSLPGSILAQKGAHKFQVTDGTLTGKCTLVNTPNLAAGQMNILINLSTITSASTTAANVAGGAQTTYVTWSSTPTGPVATPRVGDYIIGFVGTAAVAKVTAVNTASNVTIAVSGNVSAQTSTITASTYASRITNKFVYDFNNDGHTIDGENGTSNTYYTNNDNPIKFRYRLAAPDATFVQVHAA